jgi:hypothetical protein
MLAFVLALVAVVAVAAGAYAAAPAMDPASPPTPTGSIAQERARVAAEVVRLAHDRFKAGVGTIDDLLGWMRRQYEADRELPSREGAALSQYMESLGSLRIEAQHAVQAGVISADAPLRVEYYRLEALAGQEQAKKH